MGTQKKGGGGPGEYAIMRGRERGKKRNSFCLRRGKRNYSKVVHECKKKEDSGVELEKECVLYDAYNSNAEK